MRVWRARLDLHKGCFKVEQGKSWGEAVTLYPIEHSIEVASFLEHRMRCQVVVAAPVCCSLPALAIQSLSLHKVITSGSSCVSLSIIKVEASCRLAQEMTRSDLRLRSVPCDCLSLVLLCCVILLCCSSCWLVLQLRHSRCGRPPVGLASAMRCGRAITCSYARVYTY